MKLSLFIQKVRYGANIGKPYYMYRLAVNVIRHRFLGKFPLRGVDFAVDFACNFNCQHCFNQTLTKGQRKMTLQDYARVIEEAIELGAINFAFQGGEFLILKDFEELLNLVDSKRFSLSVTTNGYLLTEAMVAKLKKRGVNTITVSLDSGLAAEHDQFRGCEGSFLRAINGIKHARKAGIKVVINSCITPQSLQSEGFQALLDYARTERLLVNTIFAAPSGKWCDNEDIIFRDKDIQYYNDLVRQHAFVVRDIDSGYARRGCQGGSESIYITPYGDVLPCPYIHIRAGSIFDESLHVIRTRAMKSFFYQKKCLITENVDFIKQYLTLTKAHKQFPLSESTLAEITAWKENK